MTGEVGQQAERARAAVESLSGRQVHLVRHPLGVAQRPLGRHNHRLVPRLDVVKTAELAEGVGGDDAEDGGGCDGAVAILGFIHHHADDITSLVQRREPDEAGVMVLVTMITEPGDEFDACSRLSTNGDAVELRWMPGVS